MSSMWLSDTQSKWAHATKRRVLPVSASVNKVMGSADADDEAGGLLDMDRY
jgi:hypothetical protein